MKIGEIEQLKIIELQVTAPEKRVHDAAQQLVEYNIGSLPVCEQDGTLVGIITERDILRVCACSDPGDSMNQRVSEVMTTDVVVCVPNDDLEYALSVMTEHRVRHLPVLDNQKLVNVISIGDLVKSKLDGATAEIRFLRDYVTG